MDTYLLDLRGLHKFLDLGYLYFIHQLNVTDLAFCEGMRALRFSSITTV
jgi:hypothetical protein